MWCSFDRLSGPDGKCFYGVEETEEEEVLGDTSSFAEFVSAARKEKARDQGL